MKNLFVSLAALCVVLVALSFARNSLLDGQPTYATIAKDPNASRMEHMAGYVALQVVNWRVEDYGFWKTATTTLPGGEQITLINTPLEAKWSRLD